MKIIIMTALLLISTPVIAGEYHKSHGSYNELQLQIDEIKKQESEAKYERELQKQRASSIEAEQYQQDKQRGYGSRLY